MYTKDDMTHARGSHGRAAERVAPAPIVHVAHVNRGTRLTRSIRFTLVPVAHGNGLQKFQAARRSYR